MDRYRLRDSLSYCFVDGRPLFLDIEADRYFRLSGDTERIFTRYIEHPSEEAGEYLAQRRILTRATLGEDVRIPSICTPSRSALEQISRCAGGSWAALDVMWTVCRTRWHLSRRNLAVILGDLVSHRDQAAPHENPDEGALIHYAQAFLSARRLALADTSCLLDSIAMAHFLARRNLRSSIVLGVTSDPFSAHCWVQSGDMVLTDTLGNTRAYTVIRVI